MIISFSRLGRHGALGNQMFQISATMGIAERNNAQSGFPEWSYENYFVNPLPHIITENIFYVEKERNFHFDKYELEGGDRDLMGYFQAEQYFDSHPFQFKPEFIQSIKDKGINNGENYLFNKQGELWRQTICIHIRRGDYVNNECYYQLPATYFINALIIHFPQWQECKILILSDDIPYCKVHFSCLPNVFFEEGLSEIEAMALGTLCDHFILSNSSFSWWIAKLGEKLHSKIVHPGHLFAGKLLENDTKDFWPERWTRFQKDSYAIDLKDLTITIPVFHDHKDRKQNLDLVVCLLQSQFNTNIIIGEQGGTKFEYMKQWCRYIKFEERYFHRTKMLNVMSYASKTPYIANWDADVILPPLQIYLAVLQLREGSEMVFPYDGRFARWPRDPWFKKIEKTLDIGVFAGTKPTGHRGADIEDMYSVGGAVFWDKESFVRGGMENENMISFGPEDCERNDRYSMLGFKITRVKGYLHHINHYIGPDSSKHNPYFKHNHLEIDKIRLMKKEQLQAYVDSWPWLKRVYIQK